MLLLTADLEALMARRPILVRIKYFCPDLEGAGRGIQARVEWNGVPEASGTSVIIDSQPESVVQPWSDRLSG